MDTLFVKTMFRAVYAVPNNKLTNLEYYVEFLQNKTLKRLFLQTRVHFLELYFTGV